MHTRAISVEQLRHIVLDQSWLQDSGCTTLNCERLARHDKIFSVARVSQKCTGTAECAVVVFTWTMSKPRACIFAFVRYATHRKALLVET